MSFSLLSTVLTKLMGVLSFAMVARLLSRSDLGLIGVTGGYVALLGFLALAPESALVRDFPTIRNQLNRHVSAYIRFWSFRTVVIMAAAAAVAGWLYLFFHDTVIAIYMLGIALAINLNLFEQMITDVFYVDFKQHIVMKISLALKFLFLGMLTILFFSSHVLLYMAVQIADAALGAAIWFWLLRKHFGFRFVADIRGILGWNITDYSLWVHLSNSLTALLYRIDTFILSFLASLSVIGSYTIALEIGNFFFIVPRLLQKSVIVGTVNLKNSQRLGDVISIFTKYFLLLSVAQLAAFLLFGRWIVSVFTDTDVEQISFYALLIISGVSIMNVFRPLSTLINTHAKMRSGFLYVYLPASLIGISCYVIMGLLFGVVGVAAANIIVFAILSLFIVAFVRRTIPLPLRFTLLSDIERGLLRDLRKRPSGAEARERKDR